MMKMENEFDDEYPKVTRHETWIVKTYSVKAEYCRRGDQLEAKMRLKFSRRALLDALAYIDDEISKLELMR